GAEMGQFPTARHLASWAGMCPGNNESAGKRRSGKTTKGSRWLRAALVQAAHAAGRSKGTYLGSQYRRPAARPGAQGGGGGGGAAGSQAGGGGGGPHAAGHHLPGPQTRDDLSGLGAGVSGPAGARTDDSPTGSALGTARSQGYPGAEGRGCVGAFSEQAAKANN